MKKLLKTIKERKLVKRITLMLVALILSAFVYNIFLLPLNIVTGGTSGIATITNHLYHINPSIMVFILQLVCMLISFMYLGFEKTAGSAIAVFGYPILIDITAPIAKLITVDTSDVLVLMVFAAVLGGISSGIVYKVGFNSGGTSSLCQIFKDKVGIAISKSSFVMNGAIILLGGIYFGSVNAMYAIIYLYISNLIIDKVILGISNNKAFYIITSEEEQLKQYIIDYLRHNVTIFDVKGGFLEKKRKVLLTVIPSSEYYKVTEGIKMIDKEAFFVATDSYEVIGGK